MCFTSEIWILGIRVTSSLLNSSWSLIYTIFLLPKLYYDLPVVLTQATGSFLSSCSLCFLGSVWEPDLLRVSLNGLGKVPAGERGPLGDEQEDGEREVLRGELEGSGRDGFSIIQPLLSSP